MRRLPLLKSIAHACLLTTLFLNCAWTFAQSTAAVPKDVEGIKVVEKLGQTISLNYTFADESGKQVRLGEFFHKGRPVVVQLVYYSCPMLCGLVQNAFTKGMQGLDWTAGQQYDIVTISINPEEGAKLAEVKKANYIKEYSRPEAASGWHWLTSGDNQVKQLAEEMGFHYRYDANQKQYLHEAAVFVLTDDARISRILYGVSFPSRDLRMALLEAGEGKIGTTLDHIIFYCFHYDPVGKKYVVWATRVMQMGGAITVLAMGAMLGGFFLMERRRTRRNANTPEDHVGPDLNNTPPEATPAAL